MGNSSKHEEHKSKSESKRESFFRWLLQRLQSQAGFAFLASILVAAVGSLITWELSEIGQHQQEQYAQQQEQDKELIALQTDFVTAIVQRVTYTDDVLQSLNRPASETDLNELWPHYLDAYRADRFQSWKNQLNMEGHWESQQNLLADNRQQEFWNYLDLVIEPRFEEMHQCVTVAHDAYVSANGSQMDKMHAAQIVLNGPDGKSGCETSFKWDNQAVMPAGSVARWDHFETCIENFTYLLNVSDRIQRQVWHGDAGYTPVAKASGACTTNDSSCVQAKFLSNLHDLVSATCGNTSQQASSDED
jgi:hypothetical protein